MRRILLQLAEGDTSNLGDTTTLLDPDVVDAIKAGALGGFLSDEGSSEEGQAKEGNGEK